MDNLNYDIDTSLIEIEVIDKEAIEVVIISNNK